MKYCMLLVLQLEYFYIASKVQGRFMAIAPFVCAHPRCAA